MPGERYKRVLDHLKDISYALGQMQSGNDLHEIGAGRQGVMLKLEPWVAVARDLVEALLAEDSPLQADDTNPTIDTQQIVQSTARMVTLAGASLPMEGGPHNQQELIDAFVECFFALQDALGDSVAESVEWKAAFDLFGFLNVLRGDSSYTVRDISMMAMKERMRRQPVIEVARQARRDRIAAQQALDESRAAAREAQEASQASQKAAGESGTTRLEGGYQQYAFAQLRIARQFRRTTIVLLTLVVAIAIVFAFQLDRAIGALSGATAVASSDWHSVAYRISILAALAAIAGYLGRQAGHHRRNGEWAEAMSIQLLGLDGFVSPMRENVQDAVYVAFAQRALGDPPESGEARDQSDGFVQSAVQMLLADSRKRGDTSP